MGKVNYGGPAFPFPMMNTISSSSGMSLRDWFAGQALAGLCARISDELANEIGDGILAGRHGYAIPAYALADAMLAVREKSNGQD
jgi:hypothetical protein